MSLALLKPLFSIDFVSLLEQGYYTLPELKKNGVYCISSTFSHHIYIGSAAAKEGFAGRIGLHIRRLKSGKHSNWMLQRDFKRHGIEKFLFHIIEECLATEAISIEQKYLDITHAGNEAFSYNIHVIALSPLGTKRTEECKQRQRERQKGCKMTPAHAEQLRRVQLSNIGRIRSKEWCKKLSVAHTGKKLSQEHRARIGQANKGRIVTEEMKAKSRAKLSKPYLVINPEGEHQIIIGLTQFCKENKLDRGYMMMIANGRLNQYKGWKCQKLF